MKIRSGFVSNSSSSSFVMIGTRVNDIDIVKLAENIINKYPNITIPNYISKQRDADDWAYNVLRSSACPFDYYSEEGLFGFSIYSGSSDDYGLNDFSLSIEEIEKAITETKEIMAELGIATGEVKLIGGQRTS